jgi:hypothetical protein
MHGFPSGRRFIDSGGFKSVAQPKTQNKMKNLSKFALIAATCATLGTTAALADSPQLQNRLIVNRQCVDANQQAMSVAVYNGQRGVGDTSLRPSNQTDRVDARHQLRRDGHGNASSGNAPLR